MIPILFEKGTRYFTGGGICRLNEAIAWKVKEVLNGEFELEMSYPVVGIQYTEIKTERIIYAKPNPFDPAQAFVIYAVSKPLRGKIKIYAEHVSHRQNKITVSPFHAKNLKGALSAVQSAVVGSNPFQFATSLDVVNDINSNVPRTLRNSIYGCILPLYGGEIKYDNYLGEILSRRGGDKGFTVRYGKNLLDFNEKEDVSGIYDGVYPYYFEQDPEDEEEFEYVELPEKIIKIGETAEKIMPLNLTSEFQEAPEEEELRAAAQKYIEQNDINKGILSIDLDFAILSQTEEYKKLLPAENVELGDDVTIYIPFRGVKVRSRIVKTIYDGKKNRYESVTVGDIERDITNTIAGVKGETIINREKILIAERAVAMVSAKAKENEANVTILTKWIEDNDGDVKNIATIGATASANKAEIELIAKRTTAAETLIAQIDQDVDDERARIDILAEFQTETEKNIAEIELDVSENSAKVGLVVGTSNSGNYIKGGIIAEAINGQTEVKIKSDVLDIDVVKEINAKADNINIQSDKMKIKASGFSVENGRMIVQSGQIGGWGIGYSVDFETYVMKSTDSEYLTVEWYESYNDYRTVTGDVFTVFTNKGIWYLVQGYDLSADDYITLAKVPATKLPAFKTPSTGEEET